jgi:hypothetical protein
MIVVQAKQLILLLDGTWNDADSGPCDTNVVRLRELINRSLSDDPAASGGTQFAASRTYDGDEIQRIVFYERGVGTGAFLDQIYGGAFGEGLSDNVRRAYKFLSWHYAPGDAIFIFGFSRGAYTARSLVGLIASAGLLKRGSCSEDLEAKAWAFYHTPINDRLPADFDALTPHVHDRDSFKITCVGVFDTVGSLGVPLPMFRRKNREIYGFNNVELGSITECALHAVAIDEHREPFEATLWRKPKFKAFTDEVTVEQVWFPGGHSDVGGGNIQERDRVTVKNGQRDRRNALDDITLDWMLKRVLAKYPNFPVRLEDRIIGGERYERVWESIDESWVEADQHNSRSLIYWFRPYVARAINNYAGPSTFWSRHAPLSFRGCFVGYDRHAEPIGEMVHISVLRRYGQRIFAAVPRRSYTPENVKAVLPYIAATYGITNEINLTRQILFVDWSGTPLDPDDPKNRKTIAGLFAERSTIRTHLDERTRQIRRNTMGPGNQTT